MIDYHEWGVHKLFFNLKRNRNTQNKVAEAGKMMTIRQFFGPRNEKSVAAKTGFNAEKLLTTQPTIRSALERYFKKQIRATALGIHGKKADVVLTFEDNSIEKIQNKNGESGFHQFQRLPIDRFYGPFREQIGSMVQCRFTDKGVTKTRKNRDICTAFVGTPRQPTIEEAKELIHQTLYGLEPENAPTYLTNTIIKNGEITSLKIISMKDFITEVDKRVILPNVKEGGTVIDLGGGFTIQFHGSHVGDDNPDHPQVKFAPPKDPYSYETIL